MKFKRGTHQSILISQSILLILSGRCHLDFLFRETRTTNSKNFLIAAERKGGEKERIAGKRKDECGRKSQMNLHLAFFSENLVPCSWRTEIQKRWRKLGPRLIVRDTKFSSSSSCLPLVAAIHRWHSSLRILDNQRLHHWRRSASLSFKNFGFLAEPHVNVTIYR